MSPRVTVIMAAHQAERSVGAAVASVLSQTMEDLELVVVDDGSSDATGDIVAAHRGTVRVVRQEHGGVGVARNRGVAEAQGDLLTFCDADDVLFPRHVEELVAMWEQHEGIVTSNAWLLYPAGLGAGRTRFRGRYPAPQRQRQAILEQNVVSIMSIFPRALPAEIGPFREDIASAEDWDFWIRAVFAGWRVTLQRKPLALLRWGDTGLTAQHEQMDADAITVLRTVAERADLNAEERAYVELRLSEPGPRELARDADQALRNRRYFDAAKRYRRAAALCPSEPLLVWKSRVLSLAPPLTGPIVRARHLRLERRLGLSEKHVH